MNVHGALGQFHPLQDVSTTSLLSVLLLGLRCARAALAMADNSTNFEWRKGTPHRPISGLLGDRDVLLEVLLS